MDASDSLSNELLQKSWSSEHKKTRLWAVGSAKGSGILGGFTCLVLRGKVRDCQVGGCARKAAHGISEIDTWHLFSLTHLLRSDFVLFV